MASHIGQKIKEVLEKRGISKTELGKRLNMTSTNVHKIFKRETVDTGLLQKISEALDYDFFQQYASPALQTFNEDKEVYKTGTAPAKISYINELDQCKKEVEHLKSEMAQQEIAYLKRINELLEKKK